VYPPAPCLKKQATPNDSRPAGFLTINRPRHSTLAKLAVDGDIKPVNENTDLFSVPVIIRRVITAHATCY
jgi:hypothetical protein